MRVLQWGWNQMQRIHWASHGLGVFAALLLGAEARAVSFIGVGDLSGGAVRSKALGISDDGRVVVGDSVSSNGTEAFRFENGSLEPLGDLPGGGFVSSANDANGDGSVIVGFGFSGSGGEAFRWQNGQMQGLGDLAGGTFSSLASGVNGDGTIIVGRGDDARPPFIQAFEWQWDQSSGAMVALPGLGGGSWAFGVSADGEVSAGFSSFSAGGTFIEPTRWENGVVTSLGALSTVVLGTANLTETRAISSNGAVIVGLGLNASSTCQVVQAVNCTEAFRWEGDAVGGVMIGLGDLDSGKDGDEYVSRALAVDADGSIVGGFGTVNVGTDADPVNVKEAFVWTAEWEMRALKEVLEIDFGLDLTDWSLQEVRGISDDGLTLVGIGTRRLQSGALVSEGWVARIPEPSTAALLGLALAAIPLTRTSCEARRV